jgi:hypothetical protein
VKFGVRCPVPALRISCRPACALSSVVTGEFDLVVCTDVAKVLLLRPLCSVNVLAFDRGDEYEGFISVFSLSRGIAQINGIQPGARIPLGVREDILGGT